VTTLDRYILRTILGAVALVLAVLLVLNALFLFLDQQGDIRGNYTAADAFVFTLLNVPQMAWDLLPIATLVGSLVGLGTLARGSEITVMRASGVSVARLAGSCLMAGIVLLGVQLLLGEALAPPLQAAAKQQRALQRFADMNIEGRSGAWVRDGNLILNVAPQSGEQRFGGMLVFELSPDHRLQAVGRAVTATAGSDRRWILEQYAESRFAPDRVTATQAGRRTLSSNVSADFLGVAVEKPQDLETLTLWRMIRYYEANRLDAGPYVFAFWSRIARTVAILFAVLLAVPFVLGSLRSAGAGTRTLVGLMLGIGLILLQRLIESGTIVFDLDPVLLAWIPTLLLAVTSLGLLARAR